MSESGQISLFSDDEETAPVEDVAVATVLIEEQEDIEEIELLPFDIGEHVRVVTDMKAEDDLEGYYYLQEFHGKRGLISKVTKKPNLQYDVDFNGRTAIVYHRELLAGWPQ